MWKKWAEVFWVCTLIANTLWCTLMLSDVWPDARVNVRPRKFEHLHSSLFLRCLSPRMIYVCARVINANATNARYGSTDGTKNWMHLFSLTRWWGKKKNCSRHASGWEPSALTCCVSTTFQSRNNAWSTSARKTKEVKLKKSRGFFYIATDLWGSRRRNSTWLFLFLAACQWSQS